MKKAVLKNFAVFTGKLQAFIKNATLSKTHSSTGVLSSKYCETFKNTHFEEHLLIEQLLL